MKMKTLRSLLAGIALFPTSLTLAKGGDCQGDYVSEKYPFPHLVVIVKESGCHRQWVVSPASPEDVRCAFFDSEGIPTSKPDHSQILSPVELEAYFQKISELGGVNSWADLLDLYKLAGFHSDLTPHGKSDGC